MRLNAEVGTAKKANIAGYFVGGKTGTAEKVIHGHYSKNRLFTTFMAVVPADKPKYLFLTLMDEPQGLPETHGFATAAWNSGCGRPARSSSASAPLLGIAPHVPIRRQPFPLLAKLGYSCSLTPAIASASASAAGGALMRLERAPARRAISRPRCGGLEISGAERRQPHDRAGFRLFRHAGAPGRRLDFLPDAVARGAVAVVAAARRRDARCRPSSSKTRAAPWRSAAARFHPRQPRPSPP